MRMIAFAISLVATGCAAVSSGPFETPRPGQLALAGLPYSLPKAVVPVKVFKGRGDVVGLAIEEPQIVADPAVGMLVARLQPSPFNKENMKLTANPATGLLISVSSESEAKLLAIIEELAKTAGRVGVKGGMRSFLEENPAIFEDTFDPLSRDDTLRVDKAINAALARATAARPAVTGGHAISLTVQMADEDWLNPSPLRKRQETQPASLANCQTGVCVRAMTSRVIRVSSADGATLATKPISVPSREAIAVPVPQTILANQKVTIAIKDGIASGYDLERDSELLGIAKIAPAILSGVVAGVTQGLTDQKSIADQLKALADAEAALADAEKKRRDAVDKRDDSGPAALPASTTLVYPFGAPPRR
ncbi:hypothetical protein [Reyranella sp.]|uniref:hypothetical protein n=1 Tax=Reyranella sp. TaxID=1929291 RepID=UPI002725A883|nr:hypothetical protein [Reyranella sp.]MDO8975807.1 hypothetical protein [Reyranella sp.]